MTDDQARSRALSVFAGDVVLGVSPWEERQAILQRFSGDPDFEAELAAWEERLAPLAELVEPVRPSDGLWARILVDTVGAVEVPARPSAGFDGGEEVESPPVVGLEEAIAARTRHLERRAARWRWASAAATLLAACLAIVLVVGPERLGLVSTRQRFVAVINASGETPPLLVSVDIARREIALEPLALAPEPGRSYELWAVQPDSDPVSLGLVEQGRRSIAGLAQSAWHDPGTVLAVSVEPEGGSPSGRPTGPIVFRGKLIPVR